jgi:N-acetyl-gamma-glutamyl-phosphate reductase uncommon form
MKSVYIDGEAGTTGLQIRAMLEPRRDLELLRIDPEKRKDPLERAKLLNSADVSVLCLHDDLAKEAVGMISNPTVRVLDASTAHRVAAGWVYGFPELEKSQAERNRAVAPVGGCRLAAARVPTRHPRCARLFWRWQATDRCCRGAWCAAPLGGWLPRLWFKPKPQTPA